MTPCRYPHFIQNWVFVWINNLNLYRVIYWRSHFTFTFGNLLMLYHMSSSCPVYTLMQIWCMDAYLAVLWPSSTINLLQLPDTATCLHGTKVNIVAQEYDIDNMTATCLQMTSTTWRQHVYTWHRQHGGNMFTNDIDNMTATCLQMTSTTWRQHVYK
jgi:hypothetical protein